MTDAGRLVSAEIETAAGQERRAAALLQQLGFRILHIGRTISVSAPAELWTGTFGVSFTPVSTETAPGRTASWQRADTDAAIPDGLRGLVTGVHFVVPPEWY